MALGRYQRLEMWDSQIDRIDVDSGYKAEKLREPLRDLITHLIWPSGI